MEVKVVSVTAYTLTRAIPFPQTPSIHPLPKGEVIDNVRHLRMVGKRRRESPVLYWQMTVLIDGTEHTFLFDRRHIAVRNLLPYVRTNIGLISFP